MTDETTRAASGKQPKGPASLTSRTMTVSGQAVTLRLEPSYWEALDEIAQREDLTSEELCADIKDRMDHQPRRAPGVSLANAVRVFVVGYYRQAATERGHARAGHGRGDPFICTPFDTAVGGN